MSSRPAFLLPVKSAFACICAASTTPRCLFSTRPRLSLRSSSICPDRAITGPRHSPTRGLFTRLTVFLLLLGQVSVVNALDPDRPLTQYLRTFWGVRDGFPGGQVN